MKDQLSRREFTRVAIGAAVIGLNPDARSWVTEASKTARPFDRVPNLDGALLLDEESRRAIATDEGYMFHRVPAAVLRPGSVQDVVAMVRYANQHNLKVAIRGHGHSRYGQTQAEAGLVIDSRSLNAVRLRTPQSADTQPGALWSTVLEAMLAKGLTPRLVPGTCLDLLTVGGTLNAGGIGNMSPRYGALVDNVTDLDVVTGDGRLVTCSPEHESELFDMVLAGQGQCGVIVRAGLPLLPAPTHVTYHELTYTDLDAYLSDQLRLAREGRFDGQRGTMLRGQSGKWSFRIEIGKFFTPPNEPDIRALESDLHFSSAVAPVRMTYRDYLFLLAARGVGGPGAAGTGRPSPSSQCGSRPRRPGHIWTTFCRSLQRQRIFPVSMGSKGSVAIPCILVASPVRFSRCPARSRRSLYGSFAALSRVTMLRFRLCWPATGTSSPR